MKEEPETAEQPAGEVAPSEGGKKKGKVSSLYVNYTWGIVSSVT